MKLFILQDSKTIHDTKTRNKLLEHHIIRDQVVNLNTFLVLCIVYILDYSSTAIPKPIRMRRNTIAFASRRQLTQEQINQLEAIQMPAKK